MTPDPREIAQRIQTSHNHCGTCDINIDRVTAILAAEMPRWVPCAEELPDADSRVLIVYRGAVWTARFYKINPGYECAWLLPTGVAKLKEVTHWQPLPSPPREEAK